MRLPVLTLAIVSTTLSPAAVTAQDSACTYDRCALGIQHGFWRTQIVEGSSRRPVARIGMFAPHLPLLESRTDTASIYFREFRSAHNASFWLRLVDALGLVASTVIGFQSDSDEALYISTFAVGIGFGIWGMERQRHARNALDQAIWWYNRSLPAR